MFKEVMVTSPRPPPMLCGGLQSGPGPRDRAVGAGQCQLEPAGWPMPSLCFWGSPPTQEGIMLTPPLLGKMAWGRGTAGKGWPFGWDRPRLSGPGCLESEHPGAPTFLGSPNSSGSRGQEDTVCSPDLRPSSEHPLTPSLKLQGNWSRPSPASPSTGRLLCGD